MTTTSSPKTYHLSCTVDAYRGGWTLHAFLTHRFRYHPAHIWTERLDAGAVRVNERAAGAATIVSKGDRITYTIRHTEPDVDTRYDVLLEDAHLLAVAKSGNIPIHAGGKFIANTLVATLRNALGRDVKPVHRLDRETSGIVLFAKTRFAAAKLEAEFRERVVKKAYVAILRGEPPESFTVDRPIARRVPAEPPYFRTVDDASGKPARTAFRTLWTNAERTLVAVHPSQGRTNQIRVHAAHAGFPVLGDRIYGVDPALARAFVASGPSPDIDAAAGAPRHMLHALALAYRHPVDGREVTVRAAPPEDFSVRADFTDYDSVTFS